MGLKCDILDKIMKVLYEFPNQKLTVRALSKKTKVPKSTIQAYLKDLKKRGVIKSDNTPSNNLLFKTRKTNYFVEKIVESGLIEHLIEKLNPGCIILFGSFRKGEFVEESDVDLFVESEKKTEIDLTKFEKKLKHPIQLFVEEDINKLQSRLLNNVVNGIKLYGSFKVK